MKKCYECGKELKLWARYRHPALGKKEIVCSKCFNNVEENIKKYCNFILNEHNQEEPKSKENILNIKTKFIKWWNNLKITR